MTREVTDKIALKYVDKLRECLVESDPSHHGNYDNYGDTYVLVIA